MFTIEWEVINKVWRHSPLSFELCVFIVFDPRLFFDYHPAIIANLPKVCIGCMWQFPKPKRVLEISSNWTLLYCFRVCTTETLNFRPPPMFVNFQPFYYNFFPMIGHDFVLTNLQEHPMLSEKTLNPLKSEKIQWCQRSMGQVGQLSKHVIFYFWVMDWA